MSESGKTAAMSSGRRGVAAKRAPDDIDRRLINALQGEFPLTETPFADIGAVLGLGVVLTCGLLTQFLVLVALAALNVAGERVSFSNVIERVPVLRALDGLGRRPT